VPVIDASAAVVAVHQNHDYSYHPACERGVWEGEEARENYRLHEGKFRTLASVTNVLRRGRIKSNYNRCFVRAKEATVSAFYAVWFRALNLTRPLRNRLGLRKQRLNEGNRVDSR